MKTICAAERFKQSVNKAKQHGKQKFAAQNEKRSRNNRANSITLQNTD